MKKITGLLVLSILVVLCFGLLWAYNGPGKNLPEPQDQTFVSMLNTANHQITAADMTRFIANKTSGLKTTLSATSSKVAKTIRGGVFARSAFDNILKQPGVVGIRYYFATKDNGNPTIVLVGVNAQGLDMAATIMEGSFDCPPNCAE